CKEILIVVSKEHRGTEFVAVDLNNEGNEISTFRYSDVMTDNIRFADKVEPGYFLYEPNASVMKLGCWKSLQEKFPGLLKLSANSHLFVSESLIDNFPGRAMRIDKTVNKKDRKSLKGFPVNIVSRNYPISADELRKTLGAKEGDNMFLYASRLGSSPLLILCERLV
ncbi:MAG: SAM-dependent methyltransferase, partial [Muribaculaceae bacterium]|nr:SAM-dependent methyltransferase [Muribaculaceae bacterium]